MRLLLGWPLALGGRGEGEAMAKEEEEEEGENIPMYVEIRNAGDEEEGDRDVYEELGFVERDRFRFDLRRFGGVGTYTTMGLIREPCSVPSRS